MNLPPFGSAAGPWFLPLKMSVLWLMAFAGMTAALVPTQIVPAQDDQTRDDLMQESDARNEPSRKQADKESPTDVLKLRKLYVPTNKLPDFMTGKFLPLEIDRFNEFLNAQSPDNESKIHEGVLLLDWIGSGEMQPDNKIGGRFTGEYLWSVEGRQNRPIDIRFETNLRFEQPSRLPDGDLPFLLESEAYVGVDSSGVFQFIANQPGIFLSSVQLNPASEGQENIQIRLPETARETVIFIRLPRSLNIISDSPAEIVQTVDRDLSDASSLTLANEARKVEFDSMRLYRVQTSERSLRVGITRVGQPRTFFTASTIYKISDGAVEMLATGEIFDSVGLNNFVDVEIPAGFDVQSVEIEDSPSSFYLIDGNTETSRRLRIPIERAEAGVRVPFILRADRSVFPSEQVAVHPVRFPGLTTLQSDVTLASESNWDFTDLLLTGLEIWSARKNSIQFSSIQPDSNCQFQITRSLPGLTTKRLVLSTRNERIRATQIVENQAAIDMLKIQQGWLVQSITRNDIDGAELAWTTREIDGNPLLLIEDGSTSLRIVAERLLDPRVDYRLDDLAPMPLSDSDCEVTFDSAFLDLVGDGAVAPNGLLTPSSEMPTAAEDLNLVESAIAKHLPEVSTLDVLRDLRFRFPDRNEKFGSQFRYEAKFLVQANSDPSQPVGILNSRYQVEWDSTRFPQLLIELDADVQENDWSSPQGRPLVHRLTAREKSRLGFDVRRSIWKLQVGSSRRTGMEKVNLEFSRSLDDSKTALVLPRSVNSGSVSGRVRLQLPTDPDFAPLDLRADEVPSGSSDPNVRQFETGTDSQLFVVRSTSTKRESIGRGVHCTRRVDRILPAGGQQTVLDLFVPRGQGVRFEVSGDSRIGNVSIVEPTAHDHVNKRGNRWKVELGNRLDAMEQRQLAIDWLPQSSNRFAFVEFPILRLDGAKLAASQRIFEIDRSLMLIPISRLFSTSLETNHHATLWFPRTLFQASMNSGSVSSTNGRLDSRVAGAEKLLVVGKSVLLLIAVTVAGLFLAIAVTWRWTEHVLGMLLGFLVGAYLFSFGIAMICSFAFFGTAAGLVFRELRRLCRSIRTPISATAVMFLLAIGVPCSLPAQDIPDYKPVIFPIDDDGKSTGLVYLPLEVYEKVTATPNAQRAVCLNYQIELNDTGQADTLESTARFELVLLYSNRLTIPIAASNAVFPADGVKIDDQAIPFRLLKPDGNLEVANVPTGKVTVEVRFRIRLDPRGTDFQLPFPGCGSIVNETESSLGIQLDTVVRKQNSQISNEGLKFIEIGTGDSRYLGDARRLRIRPGSSQREDVELFELVELLPSATRRSILIRSPQTFTKDLELIFPANLELPLTNQIVRVVTQSGSSTATVKAAGENEIRLRFRDRPGLPPGNHLLDPVQVAVPARRHLVGFLDGSGRSVRPLSPIDVDAIDNFNSVWNVESEFMTQSLEFVMDAGATQRQLIQVLRDAPPLNGSIETFHFLDGESYQVRADLALSCEVPMRYFELEVPAGIEISKIQLGEQNLNFVRTVQRRLNVFFDNPIASGQYVVTIHGKGTRAAQEPDFVSIDVPTASMAYSNWVLVRRGKSSEDTTDDRAFARGYHLVGRSTDKIASFNFQTQQMVERVALEQTVRYDSGVWQHDLSATVPQTSAGRRLELQLPAGASKIDVKTSDGRSFHDLHISKEDTLGIRQVGFSMLASASKEDPDVTKATIRFQTPVSSQSVDLARAIKTPESSRTISLPQRIGSELVDWEIPAGSLVGQSNTESRYSMNNVVRQVRYSFNQQSVSDPEIEFSETVFDRDTSILHTRWFLSPNGNRNVIIDLPSRSRIRSLHVCGQPRSLKTVDDLAVEFKLLDEQFCQFVDLELVLPGSEFSIPVFRNWSDGPRFFQIRSSSPTEVTPVQRSTLDGPVLSTQLVDARRSFLAKSVSLQQVNRDVSQESQWDQVTSALVRFAEISLDKPLNGLEPGLFERLQRLPRSSEVTPLINRDAESWLLKSNRIQIEQINTGQNWLERLPIISLIIAAGIAVGFLLRVAPVGLSSIYSLLLVSSVWLGGATWIAVAPTSLFAWCLAALALLMGILFLMVTIQNLRTWQASSRPPVESDAMSSPSEATG